MKGSTNYGQNSKMKIIILVNNKFVAKALKRYLYFVFNFSMQDSFVLTFSNTRGLSRKILQSKLWLIDGWNSPYNWDPEGFRTAYKLAGTIKCLLLFYNVPEGFPEEGKFWCNPLKCNLQEKIKEVLENPPPEKADFKKLIKMWPELAKEPKHHHH